MEKQVFPIVEYIPSTNNRPSMTIHLQLCYLLEKTNFLSVWCVGFFYKSGEIMLDIYHMLPLAEIVLYIYMHAFFLEFPSSNWWLPSGLFNTCVVFIIFTRSFKYVWLYLASWGESELNGQQICQWCLRLVLQVSIFDYAVKLPTC